MAEIDSLDIKIQTDAKTTAEAISDLSKKLGDILTSLTAFGKTPGLSAVNDQFKNMAQGVSAAGNRMKSVAKQFESQTQKISRSAEEISERFKDLGKGYRISGTSDDIQKRIGKLKNQLEDAKLAKEDFEKSGRTNLGGYETAVKNVIKYTNQIESLMSQISELQNVSQNIDFKINGIEKAEKQISDVSEKIRTVSIPESAYNYNADAMRAVFGDTAVGVDNWSQAVQRFGANAGAVLNQASTETDKLNAKTKRFEESLKNLKIPPINTNNLDALKKQLQKAEEDHEKLKMKLENGITMGKISPNVDDKAFRSIKEQMAIAEMQVRALQDRIAEMQVQTLWNRISDIGNFPVDASEVDRFRISLSEVASVSGKVKSALSKIASVAKRIASVFGSGISKIGSFAKSISGLERSSDGANKSFSFGFTKFLKYVVGVESIMAAINKLRGVFKDGMGSLSIYSTEANRSMSLVKSSLDALKNSLAVAFLPIVNVVAPIISSFVDMMTRAFNVIGQFFAALTGKNFAVQAMKSFSDYAAGVSGVGSAAKKAGKDAKSGLRSFDELKTISSKDSTSGGGGSSISPGDMFETVPIEGGILGAFQKLEDLVKGKDWEGLGVYVADTINKGLQKVYDIINWENVGPKVTAFVDAFTGTFNSLADGFDWETLGRTIGTGVNTVVNTLYLLITGIDWVNLGSKLAEGMNGLVSEVHFVELGNLIGEKFMVLPRIVLGFVSDLNWGMVGAKIGGALNGVVSSIDLSQIGDMLGKGITGIFRAAINFSANFDWEEFGISIYEGINSFFENTDFVSVGQGINDFVLGLLGSLITVIDGTDWQQVGESIADMLNSIDWAAIGDKLYEAGSKIIDGLLTAFDELPEPVQNAIGFIEDFFGLFVAVEAISGAVAIIGQLSQVFTILSSPIGQIAAIIGAVVAGFKYLYENSETFRNFVDGVVEAAKNLIPGIIEGIKSAWEGFKNFWVDAWNSVIGWFKDIFGIHSPSAVMADLGVYVMEGLVNGISSLVQSVFDIFSKIKDKISEIWSAIKEKTSDVWNGIKTFVSGLWNGIKASASLAFNGIKTTITNIWDGIKKTTSNVWNTIKGFVSGLWNGIKSNASNAFGGIKSIITNIWEGIKTATTNIWNGIKNAVKTPINAIIGFINGMVNGVVSGMNGMIAALNLLSFDVPDWVPLIGGKTFGFNISSISAPQIPYLANGAVFRGGNPFLAVVNDQKRGQMNVEAPLKVIQEAVRAELERFSGNFRIAMPDTSAFNYRPKTAPEMTYAGAYGNYQYDSSAYMQNSHDGGDSGFWEMSETALYNLFYNAASVAIANSRTLSEQNEILEGILEKPTLEIGDLNHALAKDSMLRGGNYRGGDMSRLAVAEEIYR